MIKFFRKIRYDLMEKNKTSKYLKYAIGEIILVVIGILIALQLNAWKEEINANQELKTSMNLMLDDLSQDIAFYNLQIERLENRVLYLSNFAQGNYSEIDIETIPGEIGYNIPIKNLGTTYISLKEDRKFSLIKNMELKKIITSYYEVICKEYSVFANWHHKFVTETIESYLILNLPYKRGYTVDTKDVINDLENGKLLGITNYQITVIDEALVMLKNNKLLAEEMSIFINSEFN
ncbi:MAG: hypothetical protein DA407_03845 [Bacteroidetes bacterium]|nr:MAG: hypothetical protein DA407_03845 [Bacteroidota bacterium]